jgi:riboflavin kinase/FMN adenylyltransferase
VADRKRLLRHFGITHVELLPVTKEVMSTNWREFLNDLVDHGAAGFVCGDDFRFGNRGEGDATKLQAFCAERDLPCVIVPEQTVDCVRVSSTHIRHLLEQGEMEQAAVFLGHPHILTGEVVAGRSLGRTLGTPTANLRIPDGIICPRYGVYACRVLVDGQSFAAVTNIGTRPTVSGTHVTVEPWLLDFSGNLYGKQITLEFHKFLRPEQKFDSLEALRAEIRKNADQTRTYFSAQGENGKNL